MVPSYLAPLAQCPLCNKSFQACRCGTTRARDESAPAQRAPAFVKRGAYMICSRCDMAVQYCRCGELTAAETAPEDGPAAASLAVRINACKGGR